MITRKRKKTKSAPIVPSKKPENPSKPHTAPQKAPEKQPVPYPVPQKTPILPTVTDPRCRADRYRFFTGNRKSLYNFDIKSDKYLYQLIKGFCESMLDNQENKIIILQNEIPDVGLVEYKIKKTTTDYRKNLSSTPPFDYHLQSRFIKRYNEGVPMTALRLRRRKFLKLCGLKRIKKIK